jgi:uncharacterized protein YbjT (DUF2867 family)
MAERAVFLTGGTGYIGSRLIPRLLSHGHRITACVRPGSESKVPAGARALPLDPLNAAALRPALAGHDTWVQLIGTPRPAPWKAAQFRAAELRAAQAMAASLPGSDIRHAVYLSVAQPAPIMKAYLTVRQESESMLRITGTPCTFLRPWYVLGPGHRWPYALIPLYHLLERIPSTRQGALRLGLVTLDQMLTALIQAIESTPPSQPDIIDVPTIRTSRQTIQGPQ